MIIGLHGKKGSGKTTFENIYREMVPDLFCIAFADALKRAAAWIAYENKQDFFTGRKDVVLKDVTINLKEVCFDIISFAVRYETCRALNLTPEVCLEVLELGLRKKYGVKDDWGKICFGGITAGRFLQELGDLTRELIHPDIWVEVVRTRLRENQSRPVLITDIRFKNELKMVKSLSTDETPVYLFRILRKMDPKEGKKMDPNREMMEGKEVDDGRDKNHGSETALDRVSLPIIPNIGSLETYEKTVRILLEKLIE